MDNLTNGSNERQGDNFSEVSKQTDRLKKVSPISLAVSSQFMNNLKKKINNFLSIFDT
jgi:GH25 family lysozyme M1 (1,4-beta-N-acetylmuramidase)